MANDLTLFDPPAKALSLPDFLVRLAIGTVQWPGQPTRKYLAGGLSLTSSQKAEADRAKTGLVDALSPAGANGMKSIILLIAKMLMAYPGSAGFTDSVAEARAEAYVDALDDLPPWAVHAAIRKWNRGECGVRNYSFAPAPAVLREVVQELIEPYRRALDRVETALSCITLDRAMDSTPIEPEKRTIPRLRSV